MVHKVWDTGGKGKHLCRESKFTYITLGNPGGGAENRAEPKWRRGQPQPRGRAGSGRGERKELGAKSTDFYNRECRAGHQASLHSVGGTGGVCKLLDALHLTHCDRKCSILWAAAEAGQQYRANYVRKPPLFS